MAEEEKDAEENAAFLNALEQRDVRLDLLAELPAYSDLSEFEQQLRQEGQLEFPTLFKETIGFYFFKQFLISEYAGEKAVFVKDVQHYQTMRFESARRRVARLMYQRFVAEENQGLVHFPEDQKYESTFSIIQQWDKQATSNGRREAIMGASADIKTDESEMFPGLFSWELQTGSANAIGVYNDTVRQVQHDLENNRCPRELFDAVVEEVYNDLMHDVFPRFLKSSFYQKYIRTKSMERVGVSIDSFEVFRALGRGGFGTVHACRKRNSGALYAMKLIAKKLVKIKNALRNVMDERDVLTMIHSPFVTNIKYAFQDEDYLVIIMDLMVGGDLKFHLINDVRFSLERARYYAAEVLLGLEHLHSHNIVYRDLKLENVLLDHRGHVKLSDLGLAVALPKALAGKQSFVKGYAGTPGYTAPEMVANRPYGTSADLFSLGVLLYRMLCGTKPFLAASVEELDKAVMLKTPRFPPAFFPPDAVSLLQGLLDKRPEHRLGAGERKLDEIKEHPFFQTIDWGLLEAGYLDPPFVPNRLDVNASSIKDIGKFKLEKYNDVVLGDRFNRTLERFDHVSKFAVQEELVAVMSKADRDVNFERFAASKKGSDRERHRTESPPTPTLCCSIS